MNENFFEENVSVNDEQNVDPVYHTEENRPKKGKGLRVAAALLLVGALGIGTFAGVNGIIRSINGGNSNQEIAAVKSSAATAEQTAVTQTSSVSASTLVKSDVESTNSVSNSVVAYDVSGIVDEVLPCVVAITDNLEVTSSQSYNPYSYFFGYGYGNGGSYTEESAASGSGVIIGQNESELLIVTNNHVVDNSGNYTTYTVSSTGLSVMFSDGTTASATVKGTDSDNDLAVIAVSLNDISSETKDAIRIAVVGSSDNIKVGNGVIAIGNALGYGQSVTAGIVSAKDRDVEYEEGKITQLLQVDAAINPGNSGGGLFNMQGELIGINSSKYSSTSVEGMGFAIPITKVEGIIEDLMNRETIAEEDMAYIGVSGETVPDSYINNYGYPAGVVITRITANSPAEAAGLQIYDIVTSVNGKAVTSISEMKSEINSHKAGETVTLSVSRPDGRTFKEMTIEVGTMTYEELVNAASETTTEEQDTQSQNDQFDNEPAAPGNRDEQEGQDDESLPSWN